MQLSLYPPLEADLVARDPCAGRHGGAPTSMAAHARVRPHKRQTHETIVALVRARGVQGMALPEIAEALGKDRSAISGRLTELRALGRLVHLVDGGRVVRRRGAAVLIVPDGDDSRSPA